MQTFVPFPDMRRSLMVLDNVRLANQRRETVTLLGLLQKRATKGWARHPACRMWHRSEAALAYYGVLNCALWIERGGNDSTMERMLYFMEYFEEYDPGSVRLPRWWGDESIHHSHRCNLARKDPLYLHLFPDADPALPYLWPTQMPAYANYYKI